ncbi:transposase/IS protein [Pelotomaculum sp. FP]|nr:transposase/IS protein [Pelotomaculum sp. FP]
MGPSQEQSPDRLMQQAELSIPNAAIEDIEYHADRKLDKAQITRLATCGFIAEQHNIIILGASGAGKTYLSCAFGMAACRNFYTVKYIRLPDLLNELAVARGEGIFKKVMKVYKKVGLLILDEWLLVPLTSSEARDLLEIVEARHQKGSTIFSSQFTPAGGTPRSVRIRWLMLYSTELFMIPTLSLSTVRNPCVNVKASLSNQSHAGGCFQKFLPAPF